MRNRIDGSDGLIALETRRERVGEPSEHRWRTSRWIEYEYAHARDQGKHVIALVEEGVETDGPFEAYERIPLDRANPLEAFLALSETVRLWKEQIGVQRVAQIRPDSLGQLFRTNRGLTCRYRLVSREGVRGEWVGAEPVMQPSGTPLYLRGIQDDDTLVEVEILQGERPQWWSLATSQFIGVDMRAWEGGP